MVDLGNFSHINFVRQKEFRSILKKIVLCYDIMCNDYSIGQLYLPNDENEIRDVLHYKYLNCKHIRNRVKLRSYLFIPEVPENCKQGDKRGRTDLRVIIKSRTFDNPEEYFTIECKRLDGNDTLNNLYISKGIKRFIDDNKPLYSSHCQTNGMIGFLVQNVNIGSNVSKINTLLQNKYNSINTIDEISQEISIPNCYKSLHVSQNKPLQLYHLMLDFSQIIKF